MAVGVFDTVIFQNDVYQGPHAAIQLVFGTIVEQVASNTKTIKTASEE